MIKTEKGFLNAYFNEGFSKLAELVRRHPELAPYIRQCQGGAHRYITINGFPVRTRENHQIAGSKLSIEEFDEFYAKAMQKPAEPQFIGLVIQDGEKERLRVVCERHGIPIPYPRLFEDDKNYHLWVVSEDGIGLAGTIVMRGLPKVLHGVGQLVVWLESLDENKPEYVSQGLPLLVRAKDEKELRSLVRTLHREYRFHAVTPARKHGFFRSRGGYCPWLYVNVEGHIYWRAKARANYIDPAFNRYFTPKDLFDLLSIVYSCPCIVSGV